MTMDAPVQAENRIDYMDVLRGFAVMAIFAVNIKVMFQPYPFYMNPTLWSGPNDGEIATILAYVIDHKWRTIFTALFGAGLVLVFDKAEAAGGNGMARLKSRLTWLLVFGLIHLFAIWYGDILTYYAVAGFIALMFIRKDAAAQFKWALLFLAIGFGWMAVMSAPLRSCRRR